MRRVASLVTTLLIAFGIGVLAPPAASAQAGPGPELLFPSAGKTLPLEGGYLFKVAPVSGSKGYLFKVAPVSGSTGYLFGFFQNGAPAWENYANERTLSGTEYAIMPGTPA